MSLKMLPFSPEGSPRLLRLQTSAGRWTTSSVSPSTGFMPVENETDSNEGRSTNWGAISGLALSLAVSVSFWIGAFLLVVRLLK